MKKQDKKGYISRQKVAGYFPENFDFNIDNISIAMPQTLFEISGSQRNRNAVQWRQIIMTFNYINGMTLDEAGEMFNRDHTTVLHGIKCVCSAMQGYDVFLMDKLNMVISIQEADVIRTLDSSMNELISLSYLESKMLENFPNLAGFKSEYVPNQGTSFLNFGS